MRRRIFGAGGGGSHVKLVGLDCVEILDDTTLAEMVLLSKKLWITLVYFLKSLLKFTTLL